MGFRHRRGNRLIRNGEDLDAVHAVIEQRARSRGGIVGRRDLRRGELHDAHQIEHGIRRQRAARNESRSGRADARTFDLARFDALADDARVRPHRPEVEDRGEPVAAVGVVQLAGQLRRRNRRRIRPFALEEVDVVVAEAGGDRQAGTIDGRRRRRDLDPANGGDFIAVDQHDSVANRLVRGTCVDRSTGQREWHFAMVSYAVMPPTLTNGKICYIEIPATDVRRSAGFYTKVFGWNIRTRNDGSIAFDDGAGEVSGTWVTGRPPMTQPGLLFYIMVDSVAATIDAVVAHGGELVQPIGADAPEITARFRDPGGNVLGLYQQPEGR